MRVRLKLILNLLFWCAVVEANAGGIQLPPPSKQAMAPAANKPAVVVQKTYAPVTVPAKSFQLSFLMQSGSLRANVQRLAQQFAWTQVVWDVPSDYQWVGNVRVVGTDLNNVLEKILVNYPLQATFYHGNHVLVISSRKL